MQEIINQHWMRLDSRRRLHRSRNSTVGASRYGDYHVVETVSNGDIKNIEVIAGNPHEFIFPVGMQIQSGGIVKLEPTLIDINGFEMSSNLAGPKFGVLRMGL